MSALVRSSLKRLLWILIVLTGTGAGWFLRADIARLATWPLESKPERFPAPKPDRARYQVLKHEAERWRADFVSRYAACRDDRSRAAVIAEARGFLELLLPQMMLCWLGTPWDFHGTAEEPGEGRIACGYFVATVLRDAGFRVDRYKLARQPSQNILLSFLPRKALQVSVDEPYASYATRLNAAAPGIRIVGLDSHVGFLVTGEGGFRFIHSSGSAPWCVVNEGEGQAGTLQRSHYRVEGSLTGDDEVIARWIRGEAIRVKE